jgi:peptidoglycan/LPS O-acetylase OafA/YrhL
MPSPSPPTDQDRPVSGAETPKGFRLDVQGIRGFALILVLACHAELPGFEGGFVGLDIFYVLSGFLITGLIVTEIERRGTLSLIGFYGRRAKRLLPQAVTVLIVILAGSLLLFSTVRRDEVSGDVIAAALYFVNWRFISEQVDYFAFDGGAVSPVQHYWSLSVEEQFYIVWPLALLAFSLIAFRFGLKIRTTLWLIVAPIGIVSLIYCLNYTPEDPQAAYFSTFTRAWQLAAGAALMLALPRGLKMPKPLSFLLAAGGLGTLIVTTLLFKETDPYPGWRGMLAVGATMAFIIAGTATVSSIPIRLLSKRPFQYLGKISYSWYLWHWPAIVFAVAIWGELPPIALTAVTLAAWVPATITHHTIEERFRRSRELDARPRRAMAVGMAFTVTALVFAFAIKAGETNLRTAPEEAVAGAMAIDTGAGKKPRVVPQKRATALRPNPIHAREDRGRAFADGCMIKAPETDPPDCVYGDPDSEVTVALLGDSHSLQYSPPLIRLAERNGWRLVTFMRAACVIAIVDYKPGCSEWLEKALDRIEAEQPDLVITATGTTERYVVRDENGEPMSRRDSQPYLVEGFRETHRRLLATGAKVTLIRDQARAPFVPHECVADAMDRLLDCAFEPNRNDEFAFDFQAVRKMKRVGMIDPMPMLCRDDLCPAVIGNAVVYRDSYHLSATFARTLANWLERKLPDLPKPALRKMTAKQGQTVHT